MTQTNDDLLYNKPHPIIETVYNRKNILYKKRDHIFGCYRIGDIVENPSLTAQYNLASISLVVLRPNLIAVYLPPTHRARNMHPDDYIIRRTGVTYGAENQTNHGVRQLMYLYKSHPLELLKAEDFHRDFVEVLKD